MRRKRKSNPLKVTSFRLPHDLLLFLKEQAQKHERTMSFVLVKVLSDWKFYVTEQAKQPKIKK